MLTERQELILKTIITDFAQTHEPVGSKTVMKQLPIKVSSATIRNEMAVLEEHGLIEKTHSSSGRIPSSKGYRYYLDHVIEPLELPKSVYGRIISLLDRPFNQINEIVEESAKILSDLTNYTAFVEGPEALDTKITGFRIVPLSNRQIMAILVTDDGNIQNQVYTLPHNINGSEVERVVRLINDNLVGRSLNQVTPDLLKEIGIGKVDGGNSFELLRLVDDVIKDAASDQMYVEGQINLLSNTYDKSPQEIRSLYKLIEDNDIFTDLGKTHKADKSKLKRVSVKLGPELPNELLENYSLLTAEYNVGSHGKGRIALLGPSNMHYSQMIGLLEYFSNELAKKILDYYGGMK